MIFADGTKEWFHNCAGNSKNYRSQRCSDKIEGQEPQHCCDDHSCNYVRMTVQKIAGNVCGNQAYAISQAAYEETVLIVSRKAKTKEVKHDVGEGFSDKLSGKHHFISPFRE